VKRILLVNQHTVPIFTDVVNAFAASGNDITLFTGHIEEGAHPVDSRVSIIRSIRYNRGSSLSRLFTWLAFTIHYAAHLLFSRKFDSILVVTNPPLAPLITSYITRLRKTPFAVLIYDLYPNAFVQAGLLRESSLIYKWWQRVNGTVFRNAFAIFTLSDSMKAACKPYVADEDKIKVVYNWADTAYIHPISKTENAFILKHSWVGKRIVMYSGNMGLTHDLESLVHAAHQLEAERDLLFVFIGDGGKRKRLEELKNELRLSNVVFLPYQDSINFPLAMAAADIGVVTLGLGAEGISVPSKTYINFAAGCAVLAIAPTKSELSRLIEAHHAGITCEPGNAKQVAESIRSMLGDKQLLEMYRRNSLAAAQLYTPANAHKYVTELA
jgi:glycosyltransferase involved in cell wall biosynthesis